MLLSAVTREELLQHLHRAHHRRELRQTRAVAADTTELVLTRSYGKSPEKIRRDAARRAAQAQAAAQAERLRHGSLRGAGRAAGGGGLAMQLEAAAQISERRASRAVLAAAVSDGAGRGRRQRPELKRLEPVPGVQTAAELRARVQDYPMDDDGSPRRRGSRMRPSESAPALGRFRAPS